MDLTSNSQLVWVIVTTYASSVVQTVLLIDLFPKIIIGYKYFKADFDKMRDILEEIDWDMHLKDLNVSKTWDSITNNM